jgi:hypothetical protein
VPALLTNPPPTKPPTAKNGAPFPSLLPLFFLRGAEEWRLDFTQRREMNVKRGFEPTAEKTKNQRKT